MDPNPWSNWICTIWSSISHLNSSSIHCLPRELAYKETGVLLACAKQDPNIFPIHIECVLISTPYDSLSYLWSAYHWETSLTSGVRTVHIFVHHLSVAGFSCIVEPTLQLLCKLGLWSITGCHIRTSEATRWWVPFESCAKTLSPICDPQDVWTSQVAKIVYTTQGFDSEPILSCNSILNFEGANAI